MKEPRVFISYARSDGEAFATDLRQRLEKEDIPVWQDRIGMEGGSDWWLQITEALDHVEFMVLVMTPDTIQSDTVRKEWRYARRQGVCVYPVKGVPDLDFVSLPRWMRDAHAYDIQREWKKFINDLNSRCQALRVPFIVEDLPDDFVRRPGEFDRLIAYFYDEQNEEPIAITAALHGAGGYGKTILAKVLCHDKRIQEAFNEGILWVTLGEKPGDLTRHIGDLIETLTGERPGFAGIDAATARLVELLADRDMLIVIDDVWNGAHLKPFTQGGLRCARLITTRNVDTLPPNTKKVDVDAMKQDEAVALLGYDLPPGNENDLRKLVTRLGEWALLLKLANGTLRDRVNNTKQSLPDALAYVNRALDKRGLAFFDARDAVERHQAVTKTLSISFELLSASEHARYHELAVFPEDVDIPLATLEKLWEKTGALDEIDTEDLCDDLYRLSLLLRFDPTTKRIRLHDVVRKYLQERSKNLPSIHGQLLDAYALKTWSELPAEEYLWNHLAYHLVGAERKEELRALLLDFGWLQAKLEATDVSALMTDYDWLPGDEDLRLVQGALRLSAHVLSRDKSQLASQLVGRLAHLNDEHIARLLRAARAARGPALRPTSQCLFPPDGPLLRTLGGHSRAVLAVAFLPNGNLVTGDGGGTIRTWDPQSGALLSAHTLDGGPFDEMTFDTITSTIRSRTREGKLQVWDLVTCEAQQQDGEPDASDGGRDEFAWIQRLQRFGRPVSDAATSSGLRVTCTEMGVLTVRDAATGDHRWTIAAHAELVTAFAVGSNDLAVTGSMDDTARIWVPNWIPPAPGVTRDQSSWISSLAALSDGRVVTASEDGETRLWNPASGNSIVLLKGVKTIEVAVQPDDTIVAACGDGVLRFIDSETQELRDEIRYLPDHVDDPTDDALLPSILSPASLVNALTVTGKGTILMSTRDATLAMLDLEKRTWMKVLDDSKIPVTAACSLDDTIVLLGTHDGRILHVDLGTGRTQTLMDEFPVSEGSSRAVDALAVSSSGLVVAGSRWKTVVTLNSETGRRVAELAGHSGPVYSVGVLFDDFVVTASRDGTVRVWSGSTGEPIARIDADAPIHHCAVLSDQKSIAVGDRAGDVYILEFIP